MKQLLYIFLFSLFLTGCSSSKNLSNRQAERETTALLREANRHIGTRYQPGGASPRGFDCSGFVQYTYKQIGYTLPRTTAQQSAVGINVNRKNLQQGDLVFFTGNNAKSGNVGHVGIITETHRNGRFSFIHSTTSAGVRVDNSENSYWKPRYLKARRVIGHQPKR